MKKMFGDILINIGTSPPEDNAPSHVLLFPQLFKAEVLRDKIKTSQVSSKFYLYIQPVIYLFIGTTSISKLSTGYMFIIFRNIFFIKIYLLVGVCHIISVVS